MTVSKTSITQPMAILMSAEEVAKRLGEAAALLTNHGDVGADNALKTILDGKLKIWDFLWRENLNNLTDRAAHVLGDKHRAIVLVREVLNIPWPIGLDESPDDPEDEGPTNNPQGIDWFESWMDKNLPWEGGTLEMAEGFAKKLLRDAEAAGFTIEDMNLVGVDLVKHMLQATNTTPAPPTDKVYPQ